MVIWHLGLKTNLFKKINEMMQLLMKLKEYIVHMPHIVGLR